MLYAVKLNAREWKMLEMLVKAENPLRANDFSCALSLSIRTIHYSLDNIEKFLIDYQIKLFRKAHVGVWVEDKDQIRELITEVNVEQIHISRQLSKAERIDAIKNYLFPLSEAVALSELSDALEISISTLNKDLEDVAKVLAEEKLTIKKKPRIGVSIVGKEIDYRNAYMHNLKENLFFIKTFTSGKVSTCKGLDPKIAYRFFTKIEKGLLVKFSADSLQELSMCLAICINRIKQKKYIDTTNEDVRRLSKTKEFREIKKHIHILEDAFSCEFSDLEIWYFTLYLIGTKIIRVEIAEGENIYSEEEIEITSRYIFQISQFLDMDFSEDLMLRHNLLIHIKPAINRWKYNIKTRNPVLKDIQKNYKEVYEATLAVSKKISSEFFLEISEDEVGFVAMHICTSIERKKKKDNRKVKVILVCSAGIGTTKLLSSRIDAEFDDIEIIRECTSDEWGYLMSDEIDFIISTVEIKELLLKPVLVVTPLLSGRDILYIKTFIQAIGQTEVQAKNQTLDELMQLFEELSSEVNNKELLKILRAPINITEKKIKEWEEQKLLTEFIDTNRISVKSHCANKNDAITAAGRLLLADGYIDARYIEAMIQLTEELRAYIVIAPHIAMPHARPDAGAKKTGISIVTLQEPVVFGHEKHDPVKIVFALSAVDNTSHLKAMRELSMLLCEDSEVEKLMSSQTPEELYGVIKEFEDKFILQ